jgi:hypothetical protein
MVSRPTEELIRLALLAILVLGIVGTGVELLLLKHTEDWWQWVPIVLFGLGIAALAWAAARPSRASVKAFEFVMVVFLASGVLGTIQHFSGNVRDASESNPSLAGTELYFEALMGTTPALAPGAMIQLGLVGLLFTFRHPVLRGEKDRSDSRTS